VVDAVAIEPIPVAESLQVARQMPWRQPGRHVERASAQDAGRGVYLLAWKGGAPVGHAFVKWPGSLSSRHARAEGCVEIEDLFVSAEEREEGIGRALVEASEEVAREHGYAKIGLAVALANDVARRLYARRGFEDAGHGVFTLRWGAIDERGVERTRREECTYLVKTL
jgi:GNAT superfamily N-acetyltransferase